MSKAPTISLSHDLMRATDPSLLARDLGIELDEWQRDLMNSTSRRVLLNNSRQSGKSTVCAMMAVYEVVYRAPALVIMTSPSQLQSGELYKKFTSYLRALPGAPATKNESLTRLELTNGSRCVSLPGSETVRGYSGASLVLVDESARVEDSLFAAVSPMLAVTNGRLVALSTPKGKRGFWYEAWANGGDAWERIRVTADMCPRISKEFLESELAAHGRTRYEQEFFCAFHDDGQSVFSSDHIKRALSHSHEFELFY